jgi:Ca2+-binding RTX toxin-like protein
MRTKILVLIAFAAVASVGVTAQAQTPPGTNNGDYGQDLCPSGNASKVGTNGKDTLNGTKNKDNLFGRGGDDKLNGKAGNDCEVGGSGKDHVNGNSGNDTEFGGTGDDNINGNDGNDTIDGGSGKDKINGGKGTDTIKGGSGNDTINAFDGKADDVNCGSGSNDKATVDSKDTVASNCEKVVVKKK